MHLSQRAYVRVLINISIGSSYHHLRLKETAQVCLFGVYHIFAPGYDYL